MRFFLGFCYTGRMIIKQPVIQLYEKLLRLERDLNRLKIDTYFALPKKKQTSLYSEKSIRDSVNQVRDEIWQERYGKTIARVS